MPVPTELHQHRLDNGLSVLLLPDRRLPLVTVELWYHVGSKNERPGRTGFAHLFEHMLFQGSENVQGTDHFRHVQQVGGVANGSTWYDRTNYYETLPAHHLDLGLWLESDRLGFFLPALTDEKLENQRDVVMNERRQRVDNRPYGAAMERLNELLFPPDHPYHWPVIGYMDDIAAATLDEVRDFFVHNYPPSNAVLAVAGDIEPAAALERVDAWFGPLPARPAPAPVEAADPAFTGERRLEIADEVRLPRVYLGFHAPRYGDAAWYAGEMLTGILAGGKASLFYRDLVYERELARNVAAFILPTELSSTFVITATANDGIDPGELERALLGHLEQLADAVDDEELERAKNRLLTDLHEGQQSLESRAGLVCQTATYLGDPTRAFGEAARYQAVSAADVRAFARTFLGEAGRAVVTVVPREAR